MKDEGSYNKLKMKRRNDKMKKSIVGAAVAIALVGGVIIGGQTTIMGQAYHQGSNQEIHNYIDGTHDIGHHITAPNGDKLQAQVQAQIDTDNAKAAAKAKAAAQAEADAQIRAQAAKSQAAPVVQNTKAANYSCGYCGNSSCKGDCRNNTGTHHSESKRGHHNSAGHHSGGHH